MCLDRIAKEMPSVTGFGIKVFTRTEDNHLCPHYMKKYRKNYRVNKWLRDTNTKRIYMNRFDNYETGFHIYLDNFKTIMTCGCSSCRAVIRVVEYRKPVAFGMNFGHTTVVAKEMRILPIKESREWLKKYKVDTILRKDVKY